MLLVCFLRLLYLCRFLRLLYLISSNDEDHLLCSRSSFSIPCIRFQLSAHTSMYPSHTVIQSPCFLSIATKTSLSFWHRWWSVPKLKEEIGSSCLKPSDRHPSWFDQRPTEMLKALMCQVNILRGCTIYATSFISCTIIIWNQLTITAVTAATVQAFQSAAAPVTKMLLTACHSLFKWTAQFYLYIADCTALWAITYCSTVEHHFLQKKLEDLKAVMPLRLTGGLLRLRS